MVEPVNPIRYIQSQLKLYTLILLFIIQHASFEVPNANSKSDRCSDLPTTSGKGNRRGRQSSASSTSSTDAIENLVKPETLANGGGELMTPAIARELAKKEKDKEIKEKGEDDKGSLQIKIHLDLHAKVRLDLDADLYGDIVIGLL